MRVKHVYSNNFTLNGLYNHTHSRYYKYHFKKKNYSLKLNEK